MRFEGFSFGSLNRRKDVRTRCRNRPRGDPQAKEGPIQEFREQFGHTPLSIEEDIPWKCSQLVIGTGA
jgi:hypothetical protein